jgi:hypothetical protein
MDLYGFTIWLWGYITTGNLHSSPIIESANSLLMFVTAECVFGSLWRVMTANGEWSIRPIVNPSTIDRTARSEILYLPHKKSFASLNYLVVQFSFSSSRTGDKVSHNSKTHLNYLFVLVWSDIQIDFVKFQLNNPGKPWTISLFC